MIRALNKQFNKVIQEREMSDFIKEVESTKDRLDRISNQLGIQKHGTGKRKKKNKKKKKNKRLDLKEVFDNDKPRY